MRTGSLGGNLFTARAVKAVFKLKYFNTKFGFVNSFKNLLRCISAVVISYPGVISAYDEMGTTIILAGERVL
jgi:hypothetical protein